MVIAELKKSTEQKMDKSVQSFKADLGKVRTGRAHTGLLDHIHVDYYGTTMPLPQVANVTLAPRIRGPFDLSASIYNLFDERYSDPGSAELVQDLIPQNGRNLRIKLSWRF